MSSSIEHDPTDWITASSIGPPGNRVFYIQSRKDGVHVALVVEKTQVRSIAELGQELLARIGIAVTPDDVTGDMELHGPVQPEWRAGGMALGSDEAGEVFVLEAFELVPGVDEDDDAEGLDEFEGEDLAPATARFVMNREQMVALVAFAAFAVEHGGRERCQVCEGLKDPLAGCMGCPVTNGHGPKRL